MIVAPTAFTSTPLPTAKRAPNTAAKVVVSSIAPAFVKPFVTVRFACEFVPSTCPMRNVAPTAFANAPPIVEAPDATSVP